MLFFIIHTQLSVITKAAECSLLDSKKYSVNLQDIFIHYNKMIGNFVYFHSMVVCLMKPLVILF